MTRVRGIAGTAVLLVALAGLVYVGSGGLGVTAIFGIVTLVASQTASGTLSALLAGFQLRSEGHVHPGRTVTISGPAGPFTGVILAIEARVTPIRDSATGQIFPAPNTLLTSPGCLIHPKEKL